MRMVSCKRTEGANMMMCFMRFRLSTLFAAMTMCAGMATVGIVLARREHLGWAVLCGAFCGGTAGAIWNGKKGLLVGALVGALLAVSAGIAYLWVWLLFDLPPAMHGDSYL